MLTFTIRWSDGRREPVGGFHSRHTVWLRPNTVELVVQQATPLGLPQWFNGFCTTRSGTEERADSNLLGQEFLDRAGSLIGDRYWLSADKVLLLRVEPECSEVGVEQVTTVDFPIDNLGTVVIRLPNHCAMLNAATC